ncbi:hypothetical protein B0T20DRAFT_498790 [Sordaria brevicollis]|uniref:Uncharacterized protein n=1 Tax=Sordaria brevicollis TaxID=83679 RepID=A0AAE0UC81_SORBR|nr:hypothetical protein B0T20DRAFT_498790 [Sordaria brevicollis]
MAEHPLANRLPDDVDWSEYDHSALHAQNPRCCNDAVKKKRVRKQANRCWICEDTAEWEFEKYHQRELEPTATTTRALNAGDNTVATTTPMSPAPTAGTVDKGTTREFTERHGAGGLGGSSKNQAHRGKQANSTREVNQPPSNPPHPHSPFVSSTPNVPPAPQPAVNKPSPESPSRPQRPSQASKNVTPQHKGSASLFSTPGQSTTSFPTPPEPKHDPERAGKSNHSVSSNLRLESTQSLPSDPSTQSPIPTASAPCVPTFGQSGQTPAPLSESVDAQSPAASVVVSIDQAATPVPDAHRSSPFGVVDGSSLGNGMNSDSMKRKAARLVQKCRRLEKESLRMGKDMERRMQVIDKEYKQELKTLKEKRKMLKEKRKRKCMKAQQKWKSGLKKLERKRQDIEQKLKALE